jgi:hypothetical protein
MAGWTRMGIVGDMADPSIIVTLWTLLVVATISLAVVE